MESAEAFMVVCSRAIAESALPGRRWRPHKGEAAFGRYGGGSFLLPDLAAGQLEKQVFQIGGSVQGAQLAVVGELVQQ